MIEIGASFIWWEAEGAGTVQLVEEKAEEGSYQLSVNTWGGGGEYEVEGAIPFSVVPTDRTRDNGHKLKTRKSYLNTRKHIFVYCEGDQALEQVAQRGCGVYFLGDILGVGKTWLDTVLGNLSC